MKNNITIQVNLRALTVLAALALMILTISYGSTGSARASENSHVVPCGTTVPVRSATPTSTSAAPRFFVTRIYPPIQHFEAPTPTRTPPSIIGSVLNAVPWIRPFQGK
jgi:hypothetical protein